MRLTSCDDTTAKSAEGPGQGGMNINKKFSPALLSRANRQTKQPVTWRFGTLGTPTQRCPGHPSPPEWPQRMLQGTTACMCHTPPIAAPGLQRTDRLISSRKTFTFFPVKALAYVLRLKCSQN